MGGAVTAAVDHTTTRFSAVMGDGEEVRGVDWAENIDALSIKELKALLDDEARAREKHRPVPRETRLVAGPQWHAQREEQHPLRRRR